MASLYTLADEEIRLCIADYLSLMESTNGLTNLQIGNIDTDRKRVIILSGLNVQNLEHSAQEALDEWTRRRAIPFDVETAITTGVYINIRSAGAEMLNFVERETSGFRNFTPEFIFKNSECLPLLQHLAGVFSKAALKKIVGSASDNSISKPAAARIATLLNERVVPDNINKGEVLRRLDSTLEGIVRDLVGRVLLESLVDSALRKKGITFLREEEYSSLSGVIYDIRADFVVPDNKNPRAFIEVRKSSSRHASLYAKDKMFSAINWKGKHQDMLAILIVDGEWTAETLRVMANIFDYVVPIASVSDLADILVAYLAGDDSKLKWLVQFKIEPA
jgi:hypothetical protein